MTAKHAGRAVIITGASSGIGRAIALALAPSGAALWLVGRNAAGLEQTAAAAAAAGGAPAQCAALDIAAPGALADLVASVGAGHPHLFALINNAGVMYAEPLLSGDPRRWRTMFDVNLFAAIEATQAAVTAMRGHGRGGRIVTISSLAARTATTAMYGASKAALESANRALRAELENDDIRITTIVPGGFATALGRDLDPGAAARLVDSARRKGIDLSARDPRVLADAAHIGRVVDYVLDQPAAINLEEIVLRPPIAIDL